MSLTRESIAGANDCTLKPVECPEWDGTVYVRSYNMNELECMSKMDKEHGLDNMIQSVIMATCDEKGNNLFAADDAAMLRTKNKNVIERIFWASIELNKPTEEKVDDAEKNFETTQS